MTPQICEDEVLGRHLVASRDIKAGEVVVKESPLLQGPCQVTGPVCLGCLQGISQHNSEPCELCGWPLCLNPACRQAKQHLPECRWTVEKRGTPVRKCFFTVFQIFIKQLVTIKVLYHKAESSLFLNVNTYN